MSSVALADPPRESNVAAATDTLAASMLIMLALAVVQPLVGFVRGVLFCRWLAPDELGRWDLALGFLTVVAPLVDVGLPATMGRFVEHYRRRGQLACFLQWAAAVCLCLVTTASATIWLTAASIAEAVFLDAGQASLVQRMAFCLLTCVMFGFLMELLSGMRLFRVSSIAQLLRSVGLLGVAAAIVGTSGGGAAEIVTAYGVASLVAALVALLWLRSYVRQLGPATAAPLTGLWTRVLPLALWVSLTNVLSNVFDVVDRNMIVHLSGLPSTAALELVGNYHSSRVVPLMFVTLSVMTASVLLPHLSHPWEAGDRRRAELRLNLVLKLFAGLLLVGSSAVLSVAPWLFHVALHEKFAQGPALLPWTLAASSCFAMALIGAAALVCTERARWTGLAYLGALILNVGLNVWLLPSYALQGAVWASMAAKLTVMVGIFAAASCGGLRVGRATWFCALLPIAVLGGRPALVAAAAVAVALSPWLVSREEREVLLAALYRGRRKLGI